MVVLAQSELFDHFQTAVDDAGTGLPLSEDIRLYLTWLLVERVRSDRKTYEEDTLAELYGRANRTSSTYAAAVYRELGDRALYVAGFFPESLDRSLVGTTYYIDMGSAAYYRAHQWMSTVFGSTFVDMATKFEDCVVLLETVRGKEDDLEALYDQWVENPSEAAEKRLRRAGLVLPPKGTLD